MNLQENYKRLFKGKPRSNDASILFESRYKVKITKHEVFRHKMLELPVFEYEGTISGPDIPKYASFEAEGIAGDVDSASLPKDGLYALYVYIFVPINKAGNRATNNFENGNRQRMSIVNPNERDNKDAMEWIKFEYPKYPSGTEGNDFSFFMKMTKEKKDEIYPFINDAVVKYALSKGLEEGVTEKSGGTFNFKDFLDAKKKKKSKRTGSKIGDLDLDAMADVVTTIADDAGGGRDMTDDIIDELGDFYDDVYNSNDQELIDAYDDLRSTADGEPNEQADAANNLLDIIG